MSPDKVIIEPVLTEKTNLLREQNQYVFRVDARANKIEIKKAVKALFSVDAVACNVVNVKPKPKRVRYQKGFTSSWKKAIVTVSAGQKIGIFEGT